MVFCCILHCFVAKFVFLAIYAVLSHYRFFRFTHYYVEKNVVKNSARGEKMTNMRYVYNLWYFVAFYAVLLQKVLFFCDLRCFFRKIGLLQLTRYCVEKILAKNSVRGEKMTNIRYA